MMKTILAITKKIKDETGQVLIIALILLALGSLIMTPLLSYTSTGLKAGQVYDRKSDELYAADAGVEDALWNIKNDRLGIVLTVPTNYDEFDYNTTWSYVLSEQINTKDVDIDIQNIWIPKGISVPDAYDAREIIQGTEEDPPKLLITGEGSLPQVVDEELIGEYEIRITFSPEEGEEDSLLIKTIGIWLPPGFSYVPGSSELDDPGNSGEPYYSVPVISSHAGGTAVVWSFYDVSFTGGGVDNPFPGVTPGSVLRSTIHFDYKAEKVQTLEALAWVETTGVTNVSYTWDADVKVFRIYSTGTTPETGSTTEIEAYTIKSEMRQMESAISGDYFATGNAFLYADGGPLSDSKYRDVMYASKDAEVETDTNIPDDAAILGAYLYWTGWIDHDGYDDAGGTIVWSDDTSSYGTTTPVWSDDTSSYGTTTEVWRDDTSSYGTTTTVYLENCSSFDDTPPSWPFIWDEGSNWDDNGEFEGQGGGGDDDRTLTSETIPLGGYAGQTVILSWEQDASYAVDYWDTLYFAIYNGSWSGDIEAFHDDDPDSPFSYTIPEEYLTDEFRIRFLWDADNSNEYVYLDDITISTFSGDWAPGANWDIYSSQFRCYGGGSDDDRTLTRVTDIDLSAYTGQTVILSWEQDANFYVDSGDALYFALYNGSWSGDIEAFHDDNPTSPYEYTIPEEYLTDEFRIRFLWDADNSNEYVYLDDITISTFSGDWDPGANWTIYNNDQFQCQGGGSSADQTLTRVTDIDLSPYTGQTVIISWEQSADDTGFFQSLESGDSIEIYISKNGGSSFELLGSYSGEGINTTDPSLEITNDYLVGNFRIMFIWTADESDEYCYIDDITISTFSGDWAPGANWDIYNNDEFRGLGGGSDDDRTLTRVEDIELGAYSGETVIISWDQDESGSLSPSDTLYFYLSNDGGNTWSSYEVAFSDDNPTSPFEYTIPDGYLTDQFRIKFLWAADNSSGNEYCYIDDIYITVSSGGYSGLEYPEDPTPEQIVALVENNARVNTVLFGSTEDNITQVYADNYETTEPVIINGYGFDEGKGTWSYCCYADVTALVIQWIEDEDLEINGAGTYTVENAFVGVDNEVDPDYSWDFVDSAESTGYPLGTPANTTGNLKDQNAHAGWSIILVYSSSKTQGHQLYLYDINHPGFNYTQARRIDPDFDGDGLPGAIIKGFLVPEPIVGEFEAGRATVFVGEGDDFITGDYFKVNDTALLDGTGYPTNNVWNSNSQGLSLAGVDIDTFSISWASGIINTDDIEAQVNIPTDDDSIHIVYIILSFRSAISTGGTFTYIIIE
jgi:hypothetical protein